MAQLDDMHQLAALLLDSCAEALDTVQAFDANLAGAPTRRFVSPGQPVFDFAGTNCTDQLAVHVPLIQAADTSPGGLASGKRTLFGMVNHVVMVVTITRCIPDGFDAMGNYRPPSMTDLQAAARQLNADAWALWNHLFNLQSSGLLRSLCDEVFLDGVSALVPSGGAAGWTFQVRMSLDGYLFALST